MILDIIYDQACRIEEDAADQKELLQIDPLKCDTYVARSILQKAIRRDEDRLARRAASSLLIGSKGTLWRRLIVTALEDVGVNEYGVLLKLAAAIERGKLGLRQASDFAVGNFVVSAMCRASKCQAANDLHNLALNDCRYDAFRSLMSRLTQRELLVIAGDDRIDLVERYIAALTSLGHEQAPWVLTPRLAEDEVIIAALGRNVDPKIRTLYGWAFRKTRVPLALSSILLISVNNGVTVGGLPTHDDVIPPTVWQGGVPLFALDQYTRSGKAAVRKFVIRSDAWRSFVAPLALPQSQQYAAAGELIFRVESAVVRRRASWDIARVLADQSRPVGCFIPTAMVDDGLNLVRTELPLLNAIRSDTLRGEKCN